MAIVSNHSRPSARLVALGLLLVLVGAGGRLGHAAQKDDAPEAQELEKQSNLLLERERYAEALPLAERAFEIRTKELGSDHPQVATSYNNLGVVYAGLGQFAKARSFYERAIAMREKLLPPDHPDLAGTLLRLCDLYLLQAKYAEAEPPLVRALGIYERALGPEHVNVARVLSRLGSLHSEQGHYAEAESSFVRARAILEKALGPEAPETATSIGNVAIVYYDQGRYAEAEPLALKALEIREKALGPDHLHVATSLAGLGLIYNAQGRYAEAASRFERAVKIYEKVYGPDHRLVAEGLSNVALVYNAQGRYAEAEPLLVRAVKVYERALGPDHPAVAIGLNNLAALYRNQGRYAEAEPLFVRVVAIHEKAHGPDHPDLALSLNNLATFHYYLGEYAKAEPLLLRAAKIYERALRPDHPDAVTNLNNLAQLYGSQGQYAKAESLLTRVVVLYEKTLGPDHRSVALGLNNLALVYMLEGRYADAEPLLTRAIGVYERALGPDHADVAQGLSTLALLYLMRGQQAEAEPHLVRALHVLEKALGPENPDTARGMNNLAWLYAARGQHAKAEELYTRAIAVYERTLGSEHPLVAQAFNNLAICRLAAGNTPGAVEAQARCNAAREAELRRNLVVGSADAKRLYLQQTAFETEWTLTIQSVAGPADGRAARLGLEQVLRRKGRALDALVDQIAALARSATPEDRRLLGELAAARAEVARLTLGGPGGDDTGAYRKRLADAAGRVDGLEAQVGSRSARARADLSPVTLDAVARALPPGSALVEFAATRLLDPQTREAASARYVAWVLLPGGEVAWADLGDAAKIDAASAALRSALRTPRSDVDSEVKPRARALDALVFAPVRALVAGRAERLVVAPDGQLSLVPFDALVDERGRFATETFEISYLTSGRDLLRLAVRAEARSRDEIVADPDFGPTDGAAGERDIAHVEVGTAEESTASILARARFGRLAGTAEEAAEIVRVLPGARVVTGREATRREVVGLAGPRVLHIATHGFFLAGERAAPSGARGLQLGAAADPVASAVEGEDPLLRSGLALAGANLGPEGDGILTSLEAAGLDLWGTRLVVLSACDTGVGEVKNGDGVYGLRRALVLAGAETQVMSLWPVSDRGTSELMVAYYKRLAKGDGRSEAMRKIRLKLLDDEKREHPYYWSSFIVSGAWEPFTVEDRE